MRTVVDAFIHLQKLFHRCAGIGGDVGGATTLLDKVRASETDQVAAMSFVICQSFLSVDAAYAAGMKNAETRSTVI